MEDEIQKRNTDCVYFLASPLTCKKGVECEYRHSEAARLNQTDCYFWLARNCRNPTCAFRHPPLDGRPETSSEPAPLPQQPSLTVLPLSKANVPCYFYFNALCNKGESCPFLHGPASSVVVTKSALKPTKKMSKPTNAFPQENGPFTMTGKVRISTEISPNLSPLVTTLKAVDHMESQIKSHDQQFLEFHAKSENRKYISDGVEEQSPSPQASFPEFEEAIFKPETLSPEEDFITVGSLLESSEEQADDNIELEERSESSVGFDVLVDDGSELGFGDDPEYLLARERDLLRQYDFEDSVGYDSIDYPDAGIPYKHEVYNSYEYDHVENGGISDYVQGVPRRSREILLDPMSERRKVRVDEHSGRDLRDHLRKRKRFEGRQVPHSSKRNLSPRPLHRSHNENESRSSDIGCYYQGSSRQSQSQRKRNKSRQPSETKVPARRHARAPRVDHSEILRGTTLRETRSTQEFSTFSGPKTLAQIKEEKQNARKLEEDGSGIKRPCHNRTPSEVFASPKPLNDILKEKRRACAAE